MPKKWSDKYKKSIDCDNPKGFSQRAHCQGKKKVEEETNPRIPRKKGQPANSKKHSDLYTDENPKGTIHGLGFKDVATAKASVSKIRNSSRSHAHKIQAAVAMEQRAREMGKSSEAAVYRKYINSMKKKTKKMNEEAVSKKQQKFFGIVRAIQKGEIEPTTPETAKAAESMTKKDVKKFASTKHKGLPEKKEVKEDMKGYGEERFCELCGKMEYREECSYGPKMWDMFTIRNFSKSVVVPGKATYECKEVNSNWRNEIAESYLRVQERGRTYTIIFNWRGRTLKVQMFFNKFSRPTREEVRAELNKVYPGPIVLYYNPVKREPTLPLMFAGDSGGDANEPRPRRN